MEKVVLQARQGSDRRVRATSGRCSAENELEEALLKLTVRKNYSLAALYAWRMHTRQKWWELSMEHLVKWSVNLALRS